MVKFWLTVRKKQVEQDAKRDASSQHNCLLKKPFFPEYLQSVIHTMNFDIQWEPLQIVNAASLLFTLSWISYEQV